MASKSSELEKNLNDIKNELNKIIEEYKNKASLEMLNAFTRIIKNLIDMSYEQEQLIKISRTIKSKNDDRIDTIKKEKIY